jgi:hypothetical protein
MLLSFSLLGKAQEKGWHQDWKADLLLLPGYQTAAR